MALREQYICTDFARRQLAQSVLAGVFIDVSFIQANLCEATLSGTFLDVDFSEASLVGARLSGEFRGTCFDKADLAFCNMRDAQIDAHALTRAHSLRGAVMPDGRPYDGSLLLPGD